MQRISSVEQAQKAGAVTVLTQLLGQLDDADQTSAARIIAACSGPAAAPAQTRVYRYGEDTVVAVCEGCLAGDGLGARVWLAAQALARTLLAAPQLVSGQTVLEVGSGVGLIGLLAMQLRASHVTLSDNVPPLLLQLRRSVQETLALRGKQHPDMHQQQPASDVDISAGADSKQQAPNAAADDDVAGWDPEDADSCNGLDDFLAAANRVSMGQLPASLSGNQAAQQPESAASQQEASLQQSGAWDWDGMAVRALDWSTALSASHDAPPRGSSNSADTTAQCAQTDSSMAGSEAGHDAAATLPPQLPPDAQYQVVLGSDVLYEPYQAAALAATLQQRIAPGGMALLCCPVREQAVHDAFVQEAASNQLALRTEEVVPLDCDVGIADQARSYEGGFRLMALKHEADLAGQPDGWGYLPWGAMLEWQQRPC